MENIVTEKRCTKCKEVKPAEDFQKEKKVKSGLRSKCRECCSEVHYLWRIKNIDQQREYAKQYRNEKPELYLTASKIWRLKNKERQKEWHKQYYRDNKAKRDKLSAEYNKKHPEKKLQYQRNRRAKTNGNNGNITNEEWMEVVNKYGNRCLKCGATNNITMDHVVPLSLGGAHVVENVQPLCKNCNARKRDTYADYR